MAYNIRLKLKKNSKGVFLIPLMELKNDPLPVFRIPKNGRLVKRRK